MSYQDFDDDTWPDRWTDWYMDREPSGWPLLVVLPCRLVWAVGALVTAFAWCLARLFVPRRWL